VHVNGTFVHQLAYALLPQFRNQAHYNQLNNLEDQMLVQICVIQAAQDFFDMCKLCIVILGCVKRNGQLWWYQVQDRCGTSTLDKLDLVTRWRLTWGSESIVWKDRCAKCAENSWHESGVQYTAVDDVAMESKLINSQHVRCEEQSGKHCR
jgi:hypothetical protein